MKKALFVVLSLLLITHSLYAQVQYTDIDPDIEMAFADSVGQVNSYRLDLDGDFEDDISFEYSKTYWQLFTPSYDESRIRILDSIQFVTSISIINCADTVNYGDTIRDGSDLYHWYAPLLIIYQDICYMADYDSNNNHFSIWKDVSNKFVGFRKKVGPDYYYGWIRLKNEFIISEYGIQTTPNIPIIAGEGMPLTASSIVLNDIGNYKDGRDLNIKFHQSISENGLSSYRVCVVKSDSVDHFNLIKANALPDSCYTELALTEGLYELTLDADAKDVDGELITEFTSYQVFILSVVDGATFNENFLSKASDSITLRSPCDIAQNIQLSASYNGNTSYAIHYSFEKALDELSILEYRLFFIKNEELDFYTEEQAYALDNNRYIHYLPGNSNYSGDINSDTLFDVTGHLIEHLQDYTIRVLSVPDSSICNHPSLSDTSSTINLASLVTARPYIILVEDVDDNNDASDLQLNYQISSLVGISELRFFAKNQNDTLPFSTTEALETSNFYSIPSLALEDTLWLPASFIDLEGDPIQGNIAYRFYLLAVADSISADVSKLSPASNSLMIANAPYLKAGQYGQDNIHYTLLDSLVASDGQYFYKEVSVDINQDYLSDFKFVYDEHFSHYDWVTCLQITPLRNNRVALIDLSEDDCTDTLILGSSIHPSLNWTSSSSIIHNYNQQNTCYGPTTDKSGYFFGDNNFFVGLQLIYSDTLYAWLRLNIPSQNYIGNFTIKDFAYQVYRINIDTVSKPLEQDVLFYPNPASEEVIVNLNVSEDVISQLSFYTLSGALVKQFEILGNRGNLSLDDISPGVYFVNVKNNTINTSQKLIVLPK